MSERLVKHFLEEAKGNISTKGFYRLNKGKTEETIRNTVPVCTVTPAAAATAIAREKTKSIRVRKRTQNEGGIF